MYELGIWNLKSRNPAFGCFWHWRLESENNSALAPAPRHLTSRDTEVFPSVFSGIGLRVPLRTELREGGRASSGGDRAIHTGSGDAEFPGAAVSREADWSCMMGDMKSEFQEALKTTDPVTLPKVTPSAEILAALQTIPNLAEGDMLRAYGRLSTSERLVESLMELPMTLRKAWLMTLP